MKNSIIAFVMLVFVSSVGATKVQADIFTAEAYPQHWCLAQNIYYESRGSNLADMAAVANVVMNRTKDRRYPDTICGVVQQGKQHVDGSMKKNACQFSWYCDGKSDWPAKGDAWFKAQLLAWQMIEDGKYRGITEGATHYHATYVNPRWAKDFTLIGRIGEHIFYRWEK
jgi:spore germination cell wall hydrolase CwlJ-like protein